MSVTGQNGCYNGHKPVTYTLLEETNMEEQPEWYDVPGYTEAKNLGIVKSYREFKRRYLGFANGRAHLIEVIRTLEFDAEVVADEEVEAFIEDELITVERGGIIHYFSVYDTHFMGPIEESVLDEIDSGVWRIDADDWH